MDLEHLTPRHIREIEPYVPSRPDDELKSMYGCRLLHRLNNNENPLGPPPAAQAAVNRFPPTSAALYPSGDAFHLRQALAETLHMHPDQFLVGNGSCELISCVVRAFCAAGDNIVTSDQTFAVYEWVAQQTAVERRLVPLNEYTFDDEAMLRQIDARTKVIFLCNPNNPTGTYWQRARVMQFLQRVAGRCIVVLDEAYFEYVEDPEYCDGMRLLDQHPNLIIFRTFSKMFGLAGLRIGYLAGAPNVVDVIRHAYIVYSVNSIAQAAAEAALRHAREHIEETRAMVREGKKLLRAGLAQLGLQYLCGEGSYCMIKVPMSDMLLYRRLMRRGLMVRTMTGFRFPGWIRVTIAGRAVLQQLIEALASEVAGPAGSR
jgi:histidinol-phosphate aminotransferase